VFKPRQILYCIFKLGLPPSQDENAGLEPN